MDVQQEVFSYFRSELDKTYDVYDGVMPGEKAKYPFIFMGEAAQYNDKQVKNALQTGRVTISIHAWVGSTRQRGTLSGILSDISKLGRKLAQTRSYKLVYNTHDINILADTATGTALLHGVVSFTYLFYERGIS